MISDLLQKYGSDKQTWHQYGPVYDKLFRDRTEVRNVLEIGVERGYSIFAWRDAFPNATIIGFDHNDCSEFQRFDRIEIHRGVQSNRSDVLGCVQGRQFDLIVDDCSHRMGDQLCCLFWLWPHLRPGGYYVIEEFDIQDGVGPHGNMDSYQLFDLDCLRLHETRSPNGPELLVVFRKEGP